MTRILANSDSPALREATGLPGVQPGQRLTADEWVLTADAPGHPEAAVTALVKQAEALAATEATAVIGLNTRGEEIGLRLVRGGVEPAGHAARWFPVVVEEATYEPEAHRAEAETYRDRIGDRLLRPEAVDPDKRHLIADDHQRASRVLHLGYHGRVLDVGTSDGTLLLNTVRHWNLSGAVGVDVAESAIAEANAALEADPSLQGRVSFQVDFIEDLRFPDGSFDMVAACETLEHIGIGQFQRALGNLLRMLKAGGTMLMTVPNRYPNPRYEREGRARWAWPAHHQFFTELSVRQLLSPAFERLEFFPLYDGELPGESIYLICRASGRR
jgi:SAM-dependent methyltransferase